VANRIGLHVIGKAGILDGGETPWNHTERKGLSRSLKSATA
jgi:hypothetical protein